MSATRQSFHRDSRDSVPQMRVAFQFGTLDRSAVEIGQIAIRIFLAGDKFRGTSIAQLQRICIPPICRVLPEFLIPRLAGVANVAALMLPAFVVKSVTTELAFEYTVRGQGRARQVSSMLSITGFQMIETVAVALALEVPVIFIPAVP